MAATTKCQLSSFSYTLLNMLQHLKYTCVCACVAVCQYREYKTMYAHCYPSPYRHQTKFMFKEANRLEF